MHRVTTDQSQGELSAELARIERDIAGTRPMIREARERLEGQ
jgi:hypothetical protein